MASIAHRGRVLNSLYNPFGHQAFRAMPQQNNLKKARNADVERDEMGNERGQLLDGHRGNVVHVWMVCAQAMRDA